MLARADGFRFANRLAAWVEVQDGKIVDHGYTGGGTMGSTTVRLGEARRHVRGGRAPRRAARARGHSATSVRFVQTSGGRTALPGAAPREPAAVRAVQRAAGVDDARAHAERRRRLKAELIGASPFPRHWVYDDEGKLTAKAGLADFKEWYRTSFGKHTPWGDEDSEVLVTEVETALERELSAMMMRGGAKARGLDCPGPRPGDWRRNRHSRSPPQNVRRSRRPAADRTPQKGQGKCSGLWRAGPGALPDDLKHVHAGTLQEHLQTVNKLACVGGRLMGPSGHGHSHGF